MENEKDEKVHTSDVIVAENYLFSKFLLSDKLLKALNEMNYIKPSPIQLKIIPLARSRLDMIIQSKSGTGKTLSFSICLLETYDEELKFPQSLIIVPTREIAVQITNTLNGLGRHMKHFKACEFIGGTDLKNDRKRIQTTKIVVGTPGRILHLIRNEIFNTTNIKSIVFDEADKLLEEGTMGKDVQSIFNSLDHKSLQIIAATATVTLQFEKQIKRFMKNPIGITPKQEAPVLLGIKQFALELPQENDNIQLMRNKLSELAKIFTKITFKQCLLFTDSQSKTESYGNYLSKLGWKNEVINGSQEQSQRLKILNKLAKYKCRILITTDLMARGIDIDNINLVINLDLPYDCFTYLHRIGRAGRFGTYGIAISLLNGEKDRLKFRKMLAEIGSNDSMVWKFPDETVSYNFWDFNNLEQKNKLFKFDETMSDQNGNDVLLENGNIAKSKEEIIDENLVLLEITKKLVDQKSEEETFSFDPDDLLKEYESLGAESDENKLSNLLADFEENCSENVESQSPQKVSQLNCDVDALLEEYKRKCQNYVEEKEIKQEKNLEHSLEDENSSELDSDISLEAPVVSQSPKEKRCIVFVKNPKVDDDEQYSVKSNSSDSEESCQSEEEYSNEEFEESQENYREFAQLNHNHNVNEYQLYNNYVMDNYLQWRRTFFFQIANIQNYVNHSREDFI